MRRSARRILPWLLLLPVGSANAAVDAFLCIDGIPGESLDAMFPDCIPVHMASDTVFLEGQLPELRDLRFSKAADRASIPLRKALVAGEPLQATLSLRRAGGPEPSPAYWSITLFDARVTALAWSTTGGDAPQESFSLRPARVQWMFRRQLQNGSFEAPVYACWDLALGTVGDGQCPP